jgi:hypothetical protein
MEAASHSNVRTELLTFLENGLSPSRVEDERVYYRLAYTLAPLVASLGEVNSVPKLSQWVRQRGLEGSGNPFLEELIALLTSTLSQQQGAPATLAAALVLERVEELHQRRWGSNVPLDVNRVTLLFCSAEDLALLFPRLSCEEEIYEINLTASLEDETVLEQGQITPAEETYWAIRAYDSQFPYYLVALHPAYPQGRFRLPSQSNAVANLRRQISSVRSPIYQATLLPNRVTVRFGSDQFVQGVVTLSQWFGIPLESLITDIVDVQTGQPITIS